MYLTDNLSVDDELDDTITVPRRSIVRPATRPEADLEDTVVPRPSVERPPLQRPTAAVPPPLIEPELKPAFQQPSGIELTAATSGQTGEVPLQPVTEPAPVQSFYRFRIGKTVVWLDAVSDVGRRPSSPRITYGQMPRLVRVESPRQEVSSTHLELRQLGSSVVVTDMRSTNGSAIFPPGGEPRKLRQGESVVVAPGTLVDIGDGNIIEILPLEPRMGARRGRGGSEDVR